MILGPADSPCRIVGTTRIAQSVLFREALEDLFAKYAEILRETKGQKAKK